MKNYIAPMGLLTDDNGNARFDLWDCYIANEYNNNCTGSYSMDNVYIIPTKEVIEKYGAEKLDVVVLKGLSKATKLVNGEFKWNYKAEDGMKIPYIEFEKVVGSIPRTYGFPLETDWKVYLG